MADDVLSQAEVESLLNAMDAEEADAPQVPRPAAARYGNSAPRPRERVVPYDFKRPERVGKEQMRGLQSLHEGFARNFAAALSGLLRTVVDVRLTSVDQLTYSEFVFSLENPTCFNLLKAAPLEGNFVLDINQAILYPIIDRMLGGGKENGQVARRPLTEIERRLVSRVTRLFVEQLKSAWSNVVELELAVERLETNPKLVQIVPPNEVIVLVGFELTLGDARGMLNLCMPFNSIERVSQKLAAETWSRNVSGRSSAAHVQQLTRSLNGSLVEMVVTLARSSITTADLADLQVGDIITTDQDVHNRLEVAIEGVPKFTASPGALKGHKAVQVESVLRKAAEPAGDP